MAIKTVRLALALVCTLFFGAMPAHAGILQCVPFARATSGVEIYGDAWTWWGQAEGLYARGRAPREGAVLAMASSRAMPLGHVAVVREVLSDREVLLDHANWTWRGGIERGVLAVDVSPAGDWSAVRIWYGRTQSLGLRVNPAHGFIYPDAAPPLQRDFRMAVAPPSGLRINASAVIGTWDDEDDYVGQTPRRYQSAAHERLTAENQANGG